METNIWGIEEKTGKHDFIFPEKKEGRFLTSRINIQADSMADNISPHSKALLR